MSFTQTVGLRISTQAGAEPTTAQINEGELAFNLADGKIFARFGSLIKDITDSYTRAEAVAAFIRRGLSQATPGTKFGSGAAPSIANIKANGKENETPLEINNAGNSAASAVIAFHRIGSHAAFIGLDTDNKWKVGGWSMGDFAYELLHEGSYKSLIGKIGAAEVGTPAFLRNETTAQISGDQIVAGSSLVRSSSNASGGAAMSGSWRCCGTCPAGQATVFVRVL